MRVRVLAFAAVALWSVALLAAQQKVTNPEEYDKAMKKVGPAAQAMNKALASGAYGEVRAQLAIVKQGVADAESFWIMHKKEDAQKFTKDVLGKLDAFGKLVATDTVDAAAATVAAKEVGAACRSCHMVYRAQDEKQQYIIKPGTIGGN